MNLIELDAIKKIHDLNEGIKVIEIDEPYVLIEDHLGIEYNQLKSRLLQGKLDLNTGIVNIERWFTLKSGYAHGRNRYRLISKNVSLGTARKHLIRCSRCREEFGIVLKYHFEGSSCPFCCNPRQNFTVYARKAKGKPGILYLLECSDRDEHFYKIGITIKPTVHNRFVKSIPYSYRIVAEIVDSAGEVARLENIIHNNSQADKYKPKMEFAGKTECYSMIPKEMKRILKKYKITVET